MNETLSQALEMMRGAIALIVREEVSRARAETRAPSEWLTTREAAELAKVSAGTLRRWRREGRLSAIGAGSRLRWLRSDVEKLMREDGERMAPRSVPRSRPAREKSPEEQVAELLGE